MGKIREIFKDNICLKCVGICESISSKCDAFNKVEEKIREALPSEEEIEKTLKDKVVFCSLCSEEKQNECDIQKIWCEEYNETAKSIKALYENRLF